MNDKDNLLEILQNNGDLNDVKPKSNAQLTELQLAELKDLREKNKVLMQECDRLIKEKGELLSKVSGGDVLRICQLEKQLQVELDNSHCLEIELKEAKRLLKAAVEDFSEIKSYLSEPYSRLCDKWRYADEALKLIGDESSGI